MNEEMGYTIKLVCETGDVKFHDDFGSYGFIEYEPVLTGLWKIVQVDTNEPELWLQEKMTKTRHSFWGKQGTTTKYYWISEHKLSIKTEYIGQCGELE